MRTGVSRLGTGVVVVSRRYERSTDGREVPPVVPPITVGRAEVAGLYWLPELPGRNAPPGLRLIEPLPLLIETPVPFSLRRYPPPE